MKQYFVLIPGKGAVQGPFPVAMIQNAYEQSLYDDSVMVQESHGGEWASISSIFTKTQSTPPPIPATPPDSVHKQDEKENSKFGENLTWFVFWTPILAAHLYLGKHGYFDRFGENPLYDAFCIIGTVAGLLLVLILVLIIVAAVVWILFNLLCMPFRKK